MVRTGAVLIFCCLGGARPDLGNIAGLKPIDIAKNPAMRISLATATIQQAKAPQTISPDFFDQFQVLNIHQTLLLAAIKGDEAQLVACLEKGADPDHSSLWGKTALIEAIKADQPICAAILLQYDASPNHQDSTGMRPIHAAATGSAATLLVLARYGAHLNATAYDNMTALHFAAAAEKLDNVEALLGLGANPNYKNIFGELPDEMTENAKIIDSIGTKRIYADLNHAVNKWRQGGQGGPPDNRMRF